MGSQHAFSLRNTVRKKNVLIISGNLTYLEFCVCKVMISCLIFTGLCVLPSQQLGLVKNYQQMYGGPFKQRFRIPSGMLSCIII